MSTSDLNLDTTRLIDQFAESLQLLPGVEAIALGGSRAQGTHQADSDWDIAVYYRDLGLIERIREAACRGEFTIEPLPFHQAGLPSYILLAELGINKTLKGELPRWSYPDALRQSAPGIWLDRAGHTLHYAMEGHAPHGRVAQCVGLLSEAACQTAHAILAHRGEWVTNEKQILNKAGLRMIDDLVAQIGTTAKGLLRAARETRDLLQGSVRDAGLTPN